ncbi:MAG: DUF5682 family protein [Bacteroidia bacterium]|nr:DUF5682 family protein [Bacteroidia bacterium]
MSIHFFGIRHHGPGSAKSLQKALQKLQPNLLLIEGPPEAEPMIPFIQDSEMKPPVALLVYSPENFRYASFYPFAEFSPEWQALLYGLEHNIPIRFMDLPCYHSFAIQRQHDNESLNTEKLNEREPILVENFRPDPIQLLANLAGEEDSEQFWEQLVEMNENDDSVFDAIAEAMRFYRSEYLSTDESDLLREAYMRKILREAEKDGYDKIAVICGAFHVPALEKMPPKKEDESLLKGLPKMKTESTWVRWSYHRLTLSSGYGAGIRSPGWYEHLWKHSKQAHVQWLILIAQLLRKEGFDISSAHIIEAVRLSETLAVLRNRVYPSLAEINDSVQAIFSFGSESVLQLIQEKLTVGNVIGQTPVSIPQIPLQKDFTATVKSIKWKLEAVDKFIELDLRKELDLNRSILLHRLQILNIDWGVSQPNNNSKGTFKENWILAWKPEFELALLEKGIYGNTIEQAANAYVQELAKQIIDLEEVVKLFHQVMLADLKDSVETIAKLVRNLSAQSSDIFSLMSSFPQITEVYRYNDVRNTRKELLTEVLIEMAIRICIGFPVACLNINVNFAEKLEWLLNQNHNAMLLIENEFLKNEWISALLSVSNNPTAHPLLQGKVTRMLTYMNVFSSEESAKRFSYALSVAIEPMEAAYWVEGFFKETSTLLLYDDELLKLLDNWIAEQTDAIFLELMPIVRRTFSSFPAPLRKKLGEKLKSGIQTYSIKSLQNIHQERAAKIIDFYHQIYS